MNVLLTGASGLLGSEIFLTLEVLGITAIKLNRSAFLASGKEARQMMLSGFDIIIHAAANTNVEQCELEPDTCYFDNCFLTEQLFYYSRLNNIKFVFISSTGVYGRHKITPYNEYDVVTPTTIHHRSKYFSELDVLRCPKSLIIRTGWLFGGNPDNKKNFVANRIKEFKQSNGVVYANTSQLGTPTYVKDCAITLVDLALADEVGIYNVVNDGNGTRYDYIYKIAEYSSISIDIQPSNATNFKRFADVSENEAAYSLRLKYSGRKKLRSWQDALKEYLQILNP